MKKPLILFAIALATIFVQAQQKPAASPSLQDEERRFLMNYLQRSRQMMHDAVRDVTPAQWTCKPKPFRWSVAECAEHIILTERWLMSEFASKFGKGKEPAFIFDWQTPKPKPDDVPAVPLADRRRIDLLVLNDMLDRSKVDTSIARNPPPSVVLVPTGKYQTPAEMLKAFDQQRDETIRILSFLTSKFGL